MYCRNFRKTLVPLSCEFLNVNWKWRRGKTGLWARCNYFIACLVNLTALVLKGNELQCIPKDISALQKLQLLDLRSNKLLSVPEEINGLVSLRQVWLFAELYCFVYFSHCFIQQRTIALTKFATCIPTTTSTTSIPKRTHELLQSISRRSKKNKATNERNDCIFM